MPTSAHIQQHSDMTKGRDMKRKTLLNSRLNQAQASSSLRVGARAILTTVTCAAVLCSPSTFAYEQGDLIIRAGIASVNPNDSSDEVLSTEVTVDDGQALGLNFTYMLNDSFGVTLLGASPFEHDLGTKAGIEAGSTKHLPPTVGVQYFPQVPSETFQPYVGVGLNYTIFFEEEMDGELESAVMSALMATEADLELDDSFGFSVEAGVDMAINEQWGASFQVWYIDIETEATVATDVGDVKFDVQIDPFVYMLGLTFKY